MTCVQATPAQIRCRALHPLSRAAAGSTLATSRIACKTPVHSQNGESAEAGRRELAVTELFTTATIAISVLSDHGYGEWREAIQTGAKLARAHGWSAFSRAVNLASTSVISSSRT
jgi:hypothetical protein